jgi:hypothetical protein
MPTGRRSVGRIQRFVEGSQKGAKDGLSRRSLREGGESQKEHARYWGLMAFMVRWESILATPGAVASFLVTNCS